MNDLTWIDGLLHRVADVALPGGRQAKLSILIYHQVIENADEMRSGACTATDFDWQMALVSECFVPLPLGEALRLRELDRLPPRAVCVTFDDGYADNVDVALPILERYGIPATFFVSTGYLDGGRMWNDTVIEAVRHLPTGESSVPSLDSRVVRVHEQTVRPTLAGALIDQIKYHPPELREAIASELAMAATEVLPGGLMMRSCDLVHLQSCGMEIGAHTVTHPILSTLSDAEALREIREGREALEDTVGVPVTSFAYPNGKFGDDFGPREVELVRQEGFKAALSTDWGVSTRRTSAWKLRRFTPWDRDPRRFELRLIMNAWRRE